MKVGFEDFSSTPAYKFFTNESEGKIEQLDPLQSSTFSKGFMGSLF